MSWWNTCVLLTVRGMMEVAHRATEGVTAEITKMLKRVTTEEILRGRGYT